ncbi:MAG: hypothetical protein U0231_12655 [Nitrospiraceae bacterium]
MMSACVPEIRFRQTGKTQQNPGGGAGAGGLGPLQQIWNRIVIQADVIGADGDPVGIPASPAIRIAEAFRHARRLRRSTKRAVSLSANGMLNRTCSCARRVRTAASILHRTRLGDHADRIPDSAHTSKQALVIPSVASIGW